MESTYVVEKPFNILIVKWQITCQTGHDGWVRETYRGPDGRKQRVDWSSRKWEDPGEDSSGEGGQVEPAVWRAEGGGEPAQRGHDWHAAWLYWHTAQVWQVSSFYVLQLSTHVET